MDKKQILLTGASGKVGSTLIRRMQEDPHFDEWTIRAFCHNRKVAENDRISIFQGDISKREDVSKAMEGITHVVHLATSKETPSTIMDISVKGLFWLLEEARVSSTFERFILIGGDAAIGHCYYPKEKPVTEDQKHGAYPGCYALSKVLEEVMVEQYRLQYELPSVCLRAPWIMEKDDFKYSMRFDQEQFGGPRFFELVGEKQAMQYHKDNLVPVLCDAHMVPIKRNFVHVEDLVSAILLGLHHPNALGQTFNICMNEPIDYRKVADYLAKTRGFESVDIKTSSYPVWLDNSKARLYLDWHPEYDMEKLVDGAWNYQRSEDDPRVIYYPG